MAMVATSVQLVISLVQQRVEGGPGKAQGEPRESPGGFRAPQGRKPCHQVGGNVKLRSLQKAF